MIVDQGILNKVWCRWRESEFGNSNPFGGNFYTKDYAHVARKTKNAQDFELWLWAEGAAIKRENKKCYLEFFDETDAMAFVLRNS